MSYRLDELGWAQFERLCDEVLRIECGFEPERWEGRADRLRRAVAPEGIRVPGTGQVIPGPVSVAAAWREAAPTALPAPALLLANTTAPEVKGVTVVGPAELSALLDARPELRRRVPSVLGVRNLRELITERLLERSTADVAAAAELARVFVPTRAYARALDVLERHRFAVLTGPPEMGKTAIARTIGLALLTEGWEVHECVRPDQLWAAFDRERSQLFVADDAFGSTEYRPEAAERWALELDRVLRAMDDRHWLVWTSRPSPLKAGLRRIHREHGVERFPRPAEIQVAAEALDVEEKASILFRHAKAARLPERALGVVSAARLGDRRAPALHPGAHPPLRRRPAAAARPRRRAADAGELGSAVARRDPRADRGDGARRCAPCPAEHRALLVALVDTPAGPVAERELAAAARRHADVPFSKPPGELLDRLTDHFVRLVPPASVTWVHPSWRDLVIDELAADAGARLRFLERCSLDGILLALSTGGGAAGERALPLLVADGDWDAATDRTRALLPELADDELYRLLAALDAALGSAPDGRALSEAAALAASTLDAVARGWDARHAPISPTLLGAWFGAAAWLDDGPEPPAPEATWIELLPTGRVDVDDPSALSAFDDWLRLAAVLRRHAPMRLELFGFPERQGGPIGQLLSAAKRQALTPEASPLLVQCLDRLASVSPPHQFLARGLAQRLRLSGDPEPSALVPPRPPAPPERTIVERILDDLVA